MHSADTTPKVSIIIPTRNEEKNIGECLAAVFAQDTIHSFEVIVMDCRSTDRTVDIVKAYPAKLHFINPDEFCHGRTRNLGAKLSRGDYLIFLVADATPADTHWLDNIIKPLMDDPKVGGVFSRQLKRAGVNPSSFVPHKLELTSGEERIVKELNDPADFDRMPPEERYLLSKFDDVSSAMRRDVWGKAPFSDDRYWAEDLDWAVKALKAGYKVVYEPASQVLHSHGHTLAHSFKRAYLDQEVAKDLFDYVYYSNRIELKAGYFELLKRSTRIILDADAGFIKRLGWTIYNPFRLAAQVVGAYMASSELYEEGVHVNLFKSYRRTWKRWSDRSRILRTSFVINNEKRNVIFANPPARFLRRIRVPNVGATGRSPLLKFSIAMNPPSWDNYKGNGVEFVVRAGEEVIYNRALNPAKNEADRAWIDAEVDLGKYSGKRVRFRFETLSEETDYAWAGWANPRVTSPELTRLNKLRNRILGRAHFKSTSRPLRHP